MKLGTKMVPDMLITKIILRAFDRKQQAIDRALKVGGSKFKYK